MLHITVPRKEWFKEDTYEFIYSEETSLTLEHSLISMHKWESKYKKPFLNTKKVLTNGELVSYAECMLINPKSVNPLVWLALSTSQELLDQIAEYVNDPMTATWFGDSDKNKKGFTNEIVTSEIIYYWMIKLNIPIEFEKWHLNQLMTLIQVIEEKDKEASDKANGKKRGRMTSAQLSSRRALNEARKKSLGTKG